MNIIATYRGAVLVVAAAKMKAKTPKYSGRVTWKYRSPVRSACHALVKEVITASTYGGAVSRSDSIFPYPSVATTVGKKFVTDPDATMQNNITTMIHTLIS